MSPSETGATPIVRKGRDEALRDKDGAEPDARQRRVAGVDIRNACYVGEHNTSHEIRVVLCRTPDLSAAARDP